MKQFLKFQLILWCCWDKFILRIFGNWFLNTIIFLNVPLQSAFKVFHRILHFVLPPMLIDCVLNAFINQIEFMSTCWACLSGGARWRSILQIKDMGAEINYWATCGQKRSLDAVSCNLKWTHSLPVSTWTHSNIVNNINWK